MNDKQYLGDGVYVEMDDGMVRLTTSDGIVDTNEIYLEPEVLEEFIRYVEIKGIGGK